MGISGLGSFNSASFYYESTKQTKAASSASEASFNLENQEELKPLGMGFANAGSNGYGMSASQVITPDTDDIIVRVKVAGGETTDVNLSKFDEKSATAVEMFAYCQYMDSIGKGTGSKWGSWNAMKWIASAEDADGMNFGSLDNIMNKKIDWSSRVAGSKTTLQHVKTGKTISISEVMKMMEESRKLTAQQLKDGDDWRSMSAEEWDKMLDGVDKEIEAIRKYIEEMKEAQEEAAQKAAAEAAPEMKAAAASSAALAVASGFGNEPATDTEEEEEPTLEGDHEKNWTKRLKTDDQTILRTAKEAQKMEKMAAAKMMEIANGEYSKHFSYEEVWSAYKKEDKEQI